MSGKTRMQYPIEYSNFFDTIDTPEKAYYIGFIAADGCLYRRTIPHYQGMISITIAREDEYILERFKKAIGTTKPLTHFNTKYATLQIISDSLFQGLLSHNLDTRKTYGNTIPTDIPDNLYKYYLRGYFDGDGSISKNITLSINDVNVNISGYSNNLAKMQSHLDKHNIFSSIVFDQRSYNAGNGQFGLLTLTNTICKYCFLRYIYEDDNAPFLTRKRELAMNFISKVENDSRILTSKISQTYYNYAVQGVG